MNILHLDTYTEKSNLSWPHYKIHKRLLKQGEKSIILSAKGDVEEKEIFILNRGNLIPYFGISRFVRKVYFEMFKKNTNNYFYPEWNLDCITEKQIDKKLSFNPDVIIMYWTEFAFNQKLIYKLSKRYSAPILCFMMDMAPMTGGCHYAFDCTNYYKKCGRCPALNSNKENDISRRTWNFKKRYIDDTNITFIACSSTLVNQSENSSLIKNKKIERLMLGVDEDTFKPKDKKLAKSYFGIPTDKKVIFLGAASLTEKRKGIYFLLEALNILFDNINDDAIKDNITILIAGKNIAEIKVPFESKYLGYLKTEEELAKAYQACDLFVCPSIEDSGPLMINQAIMSGRPVVSFDMGVAPDLVHTDETGYRAKLKDSRELAHGIERIINLSDTAWYEMSQKCRKLALETCSLSNQTDRLNEILRRTVNKSTR